MQLEKQPGACRALLCPTHLLVQAPSVNSLPLARPMTTASQEQLKAKDRSIDTYETIISRLEKELEQFETEHRRQSVSEHPKLTETKLQLLEMQQAMGAMQQERSERHYVLQKHLDAIALVDREWTLDVRRPVPERDIAARLRNAANLISALRSDVLSLMADNPAAGGVGMQTSGTVVRYLEAPPGVDYAVLRRQLDLQEEVLSEKENTIRLQQDIIAATNKRHWTAPATGRSPWRLPHGTHGAPRALEGVYMGCEEVSIVFSIGSRLCTLTLTPLDWLK